MGHSFSVVVAMAFIIARLVVIGLDQDQSRRDLRFLLSFTKVTSAIEATIDFLHLSFGPALTCWTSLAPHRHELAKDLSSEWILQE